ncbi:MAG: alpha/beta fold hydrolase [Alphaproteobacteria bacterium]|nr:alpha/beta fold hydrolase [Alphaproteobacteria bacterium]
MERRDLLKYAALGAAGSAALATSAGHAVAAGSDKPAFVLIHGSWHGAWTWNEMTPLLAKAGFASVAIDLPGAGTRTRFPQSFLKRPLDKAAFASEKSPVALVTQADRTAAAIDAVNHAATLGNGKVVLVGHSWGGLTISHVAEAIPEKISAAVYLTAFLLPNGMTPGAMLGDKSFKAGQVAPLFMADPAKTGSLRIDPRSQDSKYVAKAKEAFYADVTDAHFAAIANLLHCDEVAATAGTPMVVTSGRYGKVARHYVRLADDKAIPAAAQDRMVQMVDTSGIGGVTTVHKMSGSHSPFFAQPEALLKVLAKIAA